MDFVKSYFGKIHTLNPQYDDRLFIELQVQFMYWTRNSMNNLLSYCGLVDARISASEKDLPVLEATGRTKSLKILGKFKLNT